MPNIIFIHGLESSGKGHKGRLFKKIFPNCLTPDFYSFKKEISYHKLLKKRMDQLIKLLYSKQSWIIIGSSFGGLMGTLYTCKFPNKVSLLILLAPFLRSKELNPLNISKVDVPVVVFHGKYDKIIPIEFSRSRAEKIFTNLSYNIVDGNHLLHSFVNSFDWKGLIEKYEYY